MIDIDKEMKRFREKLSHFIVRLLLLPECGSERKSSIIRISNNWEWLADLFRIEPIIKWSLVAKKSSPSWIYYIDVDV